ncbi:agarase [Opitutaceae bacterium TAV5]|nr:agarase [Opitutaceae bacterium TAV5]
MIRSPLLLSVLATGVLTLVGPTCLQAAGSGFFGVTKAEDGRWWLIAPDGERFISKGVCNANYHPDIIRNTNRSPYAEACARKYGTPEAWRSAVARRLLDWDFNSVGAWSDLRLSEPEIDGRHLARTPILNLGSIFVKERSRQNSGQSHAWLHGVFPDVFDPEFETTARRLAREACAPHANAPWVLGWFTDNELRWGPDWRNLDELLVSFLNSPLSSDGRQAALAVLQKRYPDIATLNRVWKTGYESWATLAAAAPGDIKSPFPRKALSQQNEEVERQLNDADPDRARFLADCDEFLGQVAERYFRITVEAVRAAAPRHMVFGSRFAYVPGQPVVDAAARWLDVISFNRYHDDPASAIARYAVFGRPLIIGEFGFRAADSGLPNTKGVGPIKKNQRERAEAFSNYVRKAMASPLVVGYHWFEHADQPSEGRFDGENSNYGLVTIQDEPYEDFVTMAREANVSAERWHQPSPTSPHSPTIP